MRIKGIITLLALSLISCEFTKDQNPLVPASDELVNRLREVMSMPISPLSGKLEKVITYGGDSEIVFSTREIYYPISGNINYTVIRDQNQDTTALFLNYYNEDNLVETSILFPFNNGKPAWQSTREYIYNTVNHIDKLFITRETLGRSLLAEYRYNLQNQLTQIEYPYGNGVVELEVYDHDAQGRISSEWKTALGQEEHKIDYLIYRYSEEGLLEAKESVGYGSLSGDRQDAFQYFYDVQGKLVLQKEFDPNFGFQQKGSSKFFYHSEN